MDTLKKLQGYMAGRKALFPGALILSAISNLLAMVPFVLIWFIIREFLTAGSNYSMKLINFYAWWAVGTSIASICLYFLALALSHLAAFRVETNMRRYAMKKIVKMPLGFFDNNTVGRIRKIIDDNAGITHVFLAHQLPDLAGTIITPVAALVMVFAFDWRLGLASLVPIVIGMVTMNLMMGGSGARFMEMYMNSMEEMNTEAVEYVRGIPVVKVFQQTVYSFKNFYNSIIKYKEMVTEYTHVWEKPMSFYTVVINGIGFFLVPVGILLIGSTGNLTAVLLNLFLYILVTPMFSIIIMRSMYLSRAAGQAAEAINRVEDLTNAATLHFAENPVSMKGFDIAFDNVGFTYPGANKRAVDGVSFNLPEGKTYALVGTSGGGKTTIARLVPRFWDVESGEVRIGGVNVKDVDHKELMENISFVFQNTKLFKTTLLENIKYGNSSASMEAVNQAVDMAQCREIIDKLPDGLNTKIGIDGTYLSGGEQQRIVLARAILKNAPIVVLDEATAFADPENEHLIQTALKKLMTGKTVLMIAHRLTTVKDADRIMVINEGKVAEQGTHKELINKRGIYTKMWNEYQKSIQWTFKEGVLK